MGETVYCVIDQDSLHLFYSAERDSMLVARALSVDEAKDFHSFLTDIRLEKVKDHFDEDSFDGIETTITVSGDGLATKEIHLERHKNRRTEALAKRVDQLIPVVTHHFRKPPVDYEQ